MTTRASASPRDILTALSEKTLAAVIEANTVDYWRTCCAHMPGAQFHEDDQMTWFITGVTSAPWYNQVMVTQLAAEEVEKIDETLALFKERELPMLWSVTGSTRPMNLAELLQARGLTQAGTLTGMAVDLEALVDDLPAPQGFAVERVRDAAAFQRWRRAYVDGFAMPESAARALLDCYAAIGFDDDLPFRHYIGVLAGETVASATLFLGAGVAGVWHVGTIPAARRQGIGTAMTLAALQDARALGYAVGTLYASDMGTGFYRRVGFKQYGKAVQYTRAVES